MKSGQLSREQAAASALALLASMKSPSPEDAAAIRHFALDVQAKAAP